MTNYTHSEETIQKLRVSHLGNKWTPEQREKFIWSKKGKRVSDKTKEKISKAQKGKPRPQTTGDKSSRAKLREPEVIQIKKYLMEGKSQRVIAEEFNISKSNIAFIQKGKTWGNVYVEGFVPTTQKTQGEHNKRAKITEATAKEIKELLSRGVSQKHVASTLNVSPHIVNRISTGKTWNHVQIG
jgi:DNA-binding NarL/FixJ family response regulator